jgi:hypothetical protein
MMNVALIDAMYHEAIFIFMMIAVIGIMIAVIGISMEMVLRRSFFEVALRQESFCHEQLDQQPVEERNEMCSNN